MQYLEKNYNLTPLDMYHGLSQVYCIKPEGRIHLYTKRARTSFMCIIKKLLLALQSRVVIHFDKFYLIFLFIPGYRHFPLFDKIGEQFEQV